MSNTSYVPYTLPEDFREQSADTQDIEFLFEDNTSGETKKLGAHKFVLLLNSEVFKAQLFGGLKETSGLITIVDSSFEGFKRFLDALYGKDPSLFELSLDALLELNYLASKYIISKLRIVVLEAIKKHVVTKENVKDIFQHAEANSHLDKIGEELDKKCYEYYGSLSATDIADMMCFYENKVEDIQQLVRMMAGFKLQTPIPISSCKYCCPCPNGKHVEQMTKEEQASYIKKGMRVVRGDDWGGYSGWTNQDGNGPGTVMDAVGVNTAAGCILVKWDNGDIHSHQMGLYGKYHVKLAP